MAYTRTNWESGVTPLSAGNMNNIEDGIEELNSKILSGYGAITGVTTTEKDQYVAFPHTMPTGVKVVVCFYASSYNRRIHVKAISQNGFTVTGALLSGTSSAVIEFNWIAYAN